MWLKIKNFGMKYMIDIPDGVFQLHLSEYLTINDVVNLDNACLNHEYRPVLLSKIEGMVLTGEGFTMSKEISLWVGKRKIYLKSLIIDWRKGCDFLMEFDNFDKRYNNLEWFNFIGYKINMIIAPQMIEVVLRRSVKLRHLLIDDCKFERDHISSFAYLCPQIEHFQSSNCAFLTDETITSIATNCSKLRILIVEADVKLKDSGIISISTHCKGLEQLSVVDSEITDESIISIATNCTGLLHLVVSRCKLLTDASIISIATQCSGLERLSVDWTNLTDKSIISIATHCWDLVCLDVSCCFLLTDKSIKSISSQCTSLKEINLACCKITDASILSIATNCPGLISLDVTGCKQLTDATCISISTNCTNLELFNLRHTKISMEGLCSIDVHCKKLIKLDVSHCSVWNYLSNPWTKESWKSLELLNVSNTDVSDRDIRVITENCSRLISLIADNCVKTTDACFLVLLFKLYVIPSQPLLENLCVMGHFGIDEPSINYIPVLKMSCEDNYYS